MRRFFACVLSAMIAVACVSSSGLAGGGGDETKTDADTPDSSSSDSATGSGDTDAATSTDGDASGAGPNLLTNGDFELGCAAWDVAFGFMSEASEAHGGTKSCKFCMDTNWEAFFEQKVTTNVEAGHTYYLEAWFKAAKTSEELEQAGYVESDVRVTSAGQGESFTKGPTFTTEWVRATALFKPTLAAVELEATLRLQQTGNPCGARQHHLRVRRRRRDEAPRLITRSSGDRDASVCARPRPASPRGRSRGRAQPSLLSCVRAA
jgi:hypothetical protein